MLPAVIAHGGHGFIEIDEHRADLGLGDASKGRHIVGMHGGHFGFDALIEQHGAFGRQRIDERLFLVALGQRLISLPRLVGIAEQFFTALERLGRVVEVAVAVQ